MMRAAVVETRELGKTFGATPVLRGINLTVGAGSAALIIGGNGSGKSTLLRIISGISRPTVGRALVFGRDSRGLGGSERRRIGMLTHQSWLYPNLTARENLEFYADLFGLENPAGVAAEWLDRVGLGAFADERVRGFSRGMEQRLALARTLAAAPQLLLLDEPFAALDSAGVAMVSELVGVQVARGCAILMTAHNPLEFNGIDLAQYEVERGRLGPYQGGDGGHGWLRSMLKR
jgi:heme ABC exporter ATP-binding subunit CcmA